MDRERSSDTAPPPGTPRLGPTRDERRAAALRDNLKRRKAQARGRAEPAPEPAASGNPRDPG